MEKYKNGGRVPLNLKYANRCRIIVDPQMRDRHLLPCRDGISRMVSLQTIFILLDKSKKKRAKERAEETEIKRKKITWLSTLVLLMRNIIKI